MRKDIVTNYENIVDSMEYNPFMKILSKYYNKIKQFDNGLSECSN